MRHLALALVLATGCRSLLSIEEPAEDQGPSPDGPRPVSGIETTRGVPQLCTGGMPGDTTCPINQLKLPEDLGAVVFVAQRLGPGQLFLSNLGVGAGPRGLHVVHPLLVAYPDPTFGLTDPQDRFQTLDLTIPPLEGQLLGGGSTTLDNFPVLAGVEMSVQFDRVDPLSPSP